MGLHKLLPYNKNQDFVMQKKYTTSLISPISRIAAVATLLTALTAGLSSCSNNPSETANTDESSKTNRIEDLQVVDCLLPGQTRNLGGQIYLTARRPIMTTASDCRIRGGEYVAYDRADYKTSLNVWMESAQAGDADAQANVGEIFERGLGSEPNYEAAIIWYTKSADQGNKRALFNLGTLHEQGLGVEADKLVAMNYYRQAWGLPEDSLVFQSAANEQQKALEEKLRIEVRKKDSQVRLLKNQIASLKVELQNNDKSDELLAQVDDLAELINDLEKENTNSKQKLASYEVAAQQRKLRTPTVITKNKKAFKLKAEDIIGKNINFGKYYALVIGVETYDNISNLDTPVNDINAIAEVLKNKYGFSVQKVINADNISIMEAINNLNEQLDEEDNLLIFFAGHGIRLQNENLESGYWLPTNADAPPRDTNWISNEFITRHLSRIKAKRVLVVADSCYAGLLSSSPDLLMLGADQNNIEFLKYKANKRSRLLLTSGGDEPVLDSAGNKHSIFASAFIDTLKNNNDIMTGPQLYKAVQARVIKESTKAEFKQEPEYKAIKGAGHEVGEFFFVPKQKSS